nr:PilN domain-containing protein [uncultured Duganella sp.]
MRAMRIDFASRSLRRALFHTHPALLALGVAGLLLCAGAALGGWKLVEQQRQRELQLRHLRERVVAMSARPVEVAPVAIPQAQAAFVNGAISQLNLPWRELQDAVAAATPRAVALVALEPDARKQVLKITAEAKTSDDMVDYVAELKQQETFSGVVLTRHDINDQDPLRPLRFQVEATWTAR